MNSVQFHLNGYQREIWFHHALCVIIDCPKKGGGKQQVISIHRHFAGLLSILLLLASEWIEGGVGSFMHWAE